MNMLFHMCCRLDHINNRMGILYYGPPYGSYHHVVIMRRCTCLVTGLAQGCDLVSAWVFWMSALAMGPRLTGKRLCVGLSEDRCMSWGTGDNTQRSAGQKLERQNMK